MRRVLLVVATVVVALALVVGLQLFLAGRDQGGVDSGSSGGGTGKAGPGRSLPDQGNKRLGAGDPAPHYVSEPPASGPHRPVPVTRDGAALTDDQILTALAAGNVILFTSARTPPQALRAVPRAVHAPFTPAQARDGQAVILARRPGIKGVRALAWRRELDVAAPSDPRLRGFADWWLGAGAPR